MFVEEIFQGGHFSKLIVIQAIFWYLGYSLNVISLNYSEQ